MSKTLKRNLSVVVVVMLAVLLSSAIVMFSKTDNTAWAMNIYAVVIDVGNLTLDVEPTTTIGEIKTAIQSETGISVDRQKVYYGFTVLSDDDACLEDYNIQEEYTLTVEVKPLPPTGPNIGGQSEWLIGDRIEGVSGTVYYKQNNELVDVEQESNNLDLREDWYGNDEYYGIVTNIDDTLGESGYWRFTIDHHELVYLAPQGDTQPIGIKLVSGSGTEEDPYVFEALYPEVLPYIEFTTTVTGNTTRYVDADNIGDTVVVTYKVTHNDGINSLLLVPEYHPDYFTIASVDDITVNSSALGAATISGGDGTKKILLENTGTKYSALDGVNEFFLTITYTITAVTNGDFEFGLLISPYVVNETSVAYYIEDGEQKGEQNQVEVKVVRENALSLIVKQVAQVEFGTNTQDYNSLGVEYDYFFVYNKQALEVVRVDELPTLQEAQASYERVINYTFSGDATPVVTWYYAVFEYDDISDEYVAVKMGDALLSAPTGAGEYVVAVSAPATDAYYAVEETYAYVHLNPMVVQVTIADKSSEYGAPLQTLTYTTNIDPLMGDSFNITLSTTATSSSPVGEYYITGQASPTGSYDVVFNEGIYTITGKAITLTALNQSADYTGSEPTVDQSQYTLMSGDTPIVINGATITISKELGVNAGTYTLTPYIANIGANYIVTTNNGTFTINSVGTTANALKAYFSGRSVAYNGNYQNLLSVDNLPSIYTYQAQNNSQKDANNYTISVTVSVLDSVNYNIDGEVSCVFSVTGASISPASVTVAADNKESFYGSNGASLTYQVVSGNVYGEDNLNVTLAVKDSNQNTITINNGTSVGTYDIVISASNSNYTITKENGTYQVKKATSEVDVDAYDVYYNRALDIDVDAYVGDIDLTPVVKIYSDSNCTQEVTPVNAGTYYVKAVVAETSNYYGSQDVQSFEIKKVVLEHTVYYYSHGVFTWPAIQGDDGNVEDDVMPLLLKDGVVITYNVYSVGMNPEQDEPLKSTTNDLTFTATDNTVYFVQAVADDGNYLPSTFNTSPAYAVTFAEGTHKGTVSGMPSPATVYIFEGQTVVQPTNPVGTGCSFNMWQAIPEIAYDFSNGVYNDITLTATWNTVTYTVTFKFTETSQTLNNDVFEFSGFEYGDSVVYPTSAFTPVKQSMEAGYNYVFADKWTYNEAEYGFTTEEGYATLAGITVTDNMTFVAVYNVTYNSFYITYYMSDSLSTSLANYEQVGEPQLVAYGATISYRELSASNIAWFRTEGWYSNADRSENALLVMPAENISVYGGYTFDIGVGDVNADGRITADDITLYRQWIVGGYDMIIVENGTEWEVVNDEDFDLENVYFLERVADNNKDQSRDIRDVSVTRMSIAGGYSWDLVTGESVTGQSIIRSTPTFSFQALVNGLNNLGRTNLYVDITDENGIIAIEAESSLSIDLGGRTLSVKSLSLITSGKDATISIQNGVLEAVEGITLLAPNGNVVIDNVTAYVNGASINLQASNNSLHFAGAVKFYDGEVGSTTPAPVNVEDGTHVVFEQTAAIVVEKLVVTENFVQSETATITVNNKAETVEVVVEGNSSNEITDAAGLITAAKVGGEYLLAANFTVATDVLVTEDMVLNLNGHTITFTEWGIEVRNNASLTINGNGSMFAQEACLYAQYAGTLIVNGGTYTSYDNFVIATNGSANRGGNVITINGGTFNGYIQSEGAIACGIYVANDDIVTINAGTFNVTNGVGVLARSGSTTIADAVVLNVSGNGTLGKVGDSRVVLPTGTEIVLDLAADYPAGEPTITNNSQYDVYALAGTFADLAALKGNYDLVGLGANINAGDNDLVYTSDMTLNLNGFTITFNGWGLEINNGVLTVNGDGAMVAQEACLYAQRGGTLIVNGGNYTSYDNFVIGTNGTQGRGGNVVTVNGGTFNGYIQSEGVIACGIYVANSDVVTVNAGTFNVTNGVGIVARSGSTTIADGVELNVSGNGTLGKVGDSRVVLPTGAEIVLDLAANYPAGTPTITNNTSYEVYTVNAQ